MIFDWLIDCILQRPNSVLDKLTKDCNHKTECNWGIQKSWMMGGFGGGPWEPRPIFFFGILYNFWRLFSKINRVSGNQKKRDMQMLQVGKKHHLENAVENCACLCNIIKCSDWNAVLECSDFWDWKVLANSAELTIWAEGATFRKNKADYSGKGDSIVPLDSLIRKQDFLDLAFSSFTHYRLKLCKID